MYKRSFTQEAGAIPESLITKLEMAVTFDQNDMSSWYFGGLSRAEATRLLLSEHESGVFLVRDSNTIHGDYVLCVREDGRVSHYIINRVISTMDGCTRYRIGDQLFPDMPALLAFYRLHYLDTTPLVRPLSHDGSLGTSQPQVLEVVVGKYDFSGRDADDLPFRRGDRLDVLRKDEEQWWTARNSAGRIGSIPLPYVYRLSETGGQGAVGVEAPSLSAPTPPRHENPHIATATAPAPNTPKSPQSNPDHTVHHTPKNNLQRTLPAWARVRQAREPNAYDNTALRLERGDIVKVTKMNINGQWEGEVNGRSGHFPFTHVEFIDDEELHEVLKTHMQGKNSPGLNNHNSHT